MQNNTIDSKNFKTGTVMDIVSGNNDSLVDLENKVASNVDEKYLHKLRTSVREYKKIGRNDKCPCGSGKKYKNCCMKTGKYENLHELSALEMAKVKLNQLNLSNIKK